MTASRTLTRIVTLGLFALGLTVVAPQAAGAQPAVASAGISKVAVAKVIRVELDPAGPAEGKLRRVKILTQATFPRCTGGAVWYYKEGNLEGNDYYSLWAAAQPGCPKGGTRDVVLVLDLPVGKKHNMVLRGAKRYDQRVSFQLAKDAVRSLFIKKMVAR